MKLLDEKWQKKLKKGDPDYEGICFSGSKLTHMFEQTTTEGTGCGIKLWKQRKLVWEYEAVNSGKDGKIPFCIIFKKMREARLQIENFADGYYLGPRADNMDEKSKVDEILLYFIGPHSGMLIHICAGEAMQYLVNVGTGNENKLIKDLWKCYESKTEGQNE